jgi:hypothetical protein
MQQQGMVHKEVRLYIAQNMANSVQVQLIYLERVLNHNKS